MQEKEQKVSPIKQRILQFASSLGISKRDFYSRIGVSRGTLESNTGITEDVVSKFISTFPEINIEWLITGNGEMTIDFANMQEKEQKSSKRIENRVSFVPSVGTPYYDVDFHGGFAEIFNDQTIKPACNVVVPGMEKASVWCNVTGHSMEPRINHGDIIALRECTPEDIQYGEIYAVVLDTIRTIKILRKGSTTKTLRYIPINTKDFDEQEYPIHRIVKIYEVIGCISRFF